MRDHKRGKIVVQAPVNGEPGLQVWRLRGSRVSLSTIVAACAISCKALVECLCKRCTRRASRFAADSVVHGLAAPAVAVYHCKLNLMTWDVAATRLHRKDSYASRTWTCSNTREKAAHRGRKKPCGRRQRQRRRGKDDRRRESGDCAEDSRLYGWPARCGRVRAERARDAGHE